MSVNISHPTEPIEPFELFMGCLGNGITCCNRKVTEYGDYKNICHIAPEGKITWYVTPENIPCEALDKIHLEAERAYGQFSVFLNSMSEVSQYAYLLERVPHSAFMHVVSMEKGALRDKIAYLKEVLSEQACFPKEILSFCGKREDVSRWRIWFTRYDDSGKVAGAGVLPVVYSDAGMAHDVAKNHFKDTAHFSWVISRTNPSPLGTVESMRMRSYE